MERKLENNELDARRRRKRTQQEEWRTRKKRKKPARANKNLKRTNTKRTTNL